jgi:hypothetical protein
MLDQKLVFSDSLVLTAGAVTNVTSTNVIDMGPQASGNLYRNLGSSDLALFTRIESTATSTGSATLTIKLVGDNNTGMTSTALIATQASLVAVAGITAGLLYKTQLPRAVNMERYLQVEYNVATAPFSAGGNVSSWIGPADSMGEFYAYNQNTGETNSF